MDPLTIATSALAILTPFLAKGAEKFAQEMGGEVYEKTKNLFSSLKSRWAGDEKVAGALENYEKEPKLYEPVVDTILREKLEADPELMTELTRQLQTMAPQVAPHIEIFQKVENGENITALEAKEFRKGKVRIDQNLTGVKGATGVKVDTIG